MRFDSLPCVRYLCLLPHLFLPIIVFLIIVSLSSPGLVLVSLSPPGVSYAILISPLLNPNGFHLSVSCRSCGRSLQWLLPVVKKDSGIIIIWTLLYGLLSELCFMHYYLNSALWIITWTLSSGWLFVRELWAVRLALGVTLDSVEWHHWLEGPAQPFLVWTDHKKLKYIHSAKRLSSRQAGWAPFLWPI